MQPQATLAEPAASHTETAHSSTKKHFSTSTGSAPGCAEVSAYIALRDILLEQAQENPTPENIGRARTANEFIENCLGEVRLPYEAQYMSEDDAAAERKNCAVARKRIASLQEDESSNG